MNTIDNDLIRIFDPCYDPSEKEIPDGEALSVLDWVEKYRADVPPKDIIWLLCRNEFLTDRQLRLFAVWCAREALSLIDSPDPRSVEACDVAERFANGEANGEVTNVELRDALAAARAAAADAGGITCAAARAAANAVARAAANAVARAAAYAATNTATCAANAAAYASYGDAVYPAYDAASYDYAANAAACATREKQLNQLLTYFEA